MSKLIIIGDIHLTDNKAKLIQCRHVFDYILNNYNNNEYLFLGDVFDTPYPNSNLIKEWLTFITRLNGKKIIITGNHDRNQNINSLSMLECFDDIEVIDEPTIKTICNKKWLLLPHVDNKGNIYDYYNAYLNDFDDNFDFIAHHLETDTSHFSEKFVDLSKYRNKCEILGGHIHTKTTGYLGSVCKTSSAEKNDVKYIAIFDSNKINYEAIPSFLEYKSINYPEKINNDDLSNNIIWTINNAPSKSIVLDYYKNIVINKVVLQDTIVNNTKLLNNDDNEHDYFNDFILENKIDNKIVDKCMEILK